MIFCTIGTQAPFDRLIKALDRIAIDVDEKIVAQTLCGNYNPQKIETVGFLSVGDFNKMCQQSRIIVAHAGIGTIVSALQLRKPIIVFPRIAELGEHRNNHQMATAEMFEKMNLVHVAHDESALKKYLLSSDIEPLKPVSDFASEQLINEIRLIVEK